jgi:hypothetical protein
MVDRVTLPDAVCTYRREFVILHIFNIANRCNMLRSRETGVVMK